VGNIAGMFGNDGDNRLITKFVQPAVGCNTWQVPDLADPGMTTQANAINVLQSMTFSPQPWALLPAMDPMTTTNGVSDLAKINLYKASVYEPQLGRIEEADTAHFCNNYAAVAVPRFTNLKMRLTMSASPAADMNLFMFMKMRASATYGPNGLGCAVLTQKPDPFVNL